MMVSMSTTAVLLLLFLLLMVVVLLLFVLIHGTAAMNDGEGCDAGEGATGRDAPESLP
jgi:hypothetical protein